MAGEQETLPTLAEAVRDAVARLGESALAELEADLKADEAVEGTLGRMLGVIAVQNRATHESLIRIAEALDALSEHLRGKPFQVEYLDDDGSS